MSLHRLLRRQIAQQLPQAPEREDLGPLFQAISDAYEEFDADRALLERSLDLSSNELLQANTELRAVVQAFPDLFLWIDPKGTITACRARTAEDLFLPVGDLIGRQIQNMPSSEVGNKFRQAIAEINGGASIVTVEYSLNLKGVEQHYEARLLPLLETGILVIIRNITTRKRTERSLHEREQQLRQAQKTEAIGQLAGGIAHDFNNLLTAILGFSALLRGSLQGREEDLYRLEQISQAATRAAALTRQLLAYGRKQVLENRVVNLNTVVTGITRLVAPLIGADIELRTALGNPLGAVSADPGQIEQVIMNLVLNARDAMPNGGTLTIQTSDVTTEPNPEGDLVGEGSGARVMLSVSDTGRGIDPETQARLFEPFFTTKEPGKGSGLGLPMVYGIVKQSGGELEVSSESGRGTTFRIFLPRVGMGSTDMPQATEGTPSRLRQTVLLVDDEPLVRALAREVLLRQGYRVLEASCASEALALEEGHSGAIDMLVTDVIMPGASGPELAANLVTRRPDMQVLYMSGYPGEAISSRGVLSEGVQFLQKPFTAEALVEKARETLDSAQRKVTAHEGT